MLKSNIIFLKNAQNPVKILFLNLAALTIVLSMFFCLSLAAKKTNVNISVYETEYISLASSNLPYYALMTSARIFIAVIFSLIFALCVSTLAAKSKKAEEIILPLLDVMQSIPILGYASFAVTFFVALSPHKVLGVEMAVIFVIFTSQVWNITFSMHQSLKTVPQDIIEASIIFGLSPWQRFWLAELPFAIPGLVWNIMVSVSGSWFFIVASEAISVGNINYTLPGIGSYLGAAIARKDWHAIIYSILTTLILIILYNKLIFQPLVVWARKFKYEMVNAQEISGSWIYNILSKSVLLKILFKPFSWFISKIFKFSFRSSLSLPSYKQHAIAKSKSFNYAWYLSIAFLTASLAYYIFSFLYNFSNLSQLTHVLFLGAITALRIIVLIFLALIILIPIGIYIGLNEKLAAGVQPVILFLAAFPANLLFPFFVIIIVSNNLNPNIWLSPLIILGAQWYILLNIIAGVSALPRELLEAASLFNIKGLIFIRKVILPSILPYIITGSLCASGGAWNASIVAEAVNWGGTTLYATGLGAYIAQNTIAGEYHNISLGVCIMCFYVMLLNKLVWRPLYKLTEKTLHLG
ncbi:anion ABC transporter permease [endosymbiont of Acanthamoeba sp. UWC8]|uniref:ABC transporter permease n=1 Tax=endosymbiont of Acanthamoeba sp. UWC8 TaxID=86106 RepID=UPI0004D14A91|nr:ABC transporter permease subunit [endosymbiont of Acanthamoeba sp. UWC8]AIF81319.1 anion ABC transporter permease [endosymbiont of Acanthamoeba sp. UWC8]